MLDKGILCSAALSELDQFDKMINWMLLTYFGCLGLGWGLLLFDWVWNKTHKLHSQVQQMFTHASFNALTKAQGSLDFCLYLQVCIVKPGLPTVRSTAATCYRSHG